MILYNEKKVVMNLNSLGIYASFEVRVKGYTPINLGLITRKHYDGVIV